MLIKLEMIALPFTEVVIKEGHQCLKMLPGNQMYDYVAENCNDCITDVFYAVEEGIYAEVANFDHTIEMLTKYKCQSIYGISEDGKALDNDQVIDSYHEGIFPLQDYGVADNVEQIKMYYKGIIDNSDVKCVISYFTIEKKTEPASGGWRWHKWGPYIGDKTPQYEYIVDEDVDIEAVICFHVHALEEKC